MLAVAFDPGTTTGICIGLLEENKLWVAPDERKFGLTQLYDCLIWFEPYDPYVIYEDFQYRNYARAGLDLTPVKMIGIIELFSENNEGKFFKQTPAQGKGFFSDTRLKNMDIYKVGKQHGRDATRHLMQWLTFGAGSQFTTEFNTDNPLPIEMIESADIYERIRG